MKFENLMVKVRSLIRIFLFLKKKSEREKGYLNQWRRRRRRREGKCRNKSEEERKAKRLKGEEKDETLQREETVLEREN